MTAKLQLQWSSSRTCKLCSTDKKDYRMSEYIVYKSWISKAWHCAFCNRYEWEMKK